MTNNQFQQYCAKMLAAQGNIIELLARILTTQIAIAHFQTDDGGEIIALLKQQNKEAIDCAFEGASALGDRAAELQQLNQETES